MSNDYSEGPIKVGGNPKDLLKDRGVEYDGAGYAPEVPDYLGYLLGLLLLWLVFTGYQSVVGMVSDPDSTVSKVNAKAEVLRAQAEQARKDAEAHVDAVVASAEVPLQILRKEVDHARGRLRGEPVSTGEESWLLEQLDSLNLAITNLAISAKDTMTSWFSGAGAEEHSEVERPSNESANQARTDSLESF
ncbi:MAG: hypothetical protein KDD69_05885 [Bdellovibrionales bacterium]|nr:hypothetical protein [Bdellovibrionales bacterium]